MYKILSDLLSDKKSDTVFSCFGFWHFLYTAMIIVAILFIVFFFKNKSNDVKSKVLNVTVTIAFGLYILDFFMMPFAYGEIDLEKLPFHICTAMCVACFLSRHNSFFSRFKTELALLGLISNLIYVIYPAGLGWYSISPFSYRVIQTVLFHGVMTAYGIFVLAFESPNLKLKNSYRDLTAITVMTLWAILGNTLYNGEYGDYSHAFNWFFVVRDPFYILPENISPYIMPFIMVLVIFTSDMLIYAIYLPIKKHSSHAKRG